MSITLGQIAEFLEKREMRFERDDEKDFVTTGIGDAENSAILFIRARDDGANFNLQMEPIKKDKSGMLDVDNDHPHLHKLLMFLLLKNYQMKYGNWEYDYNDGDLRFAVEIPIEDGDMTYSQFERVISVCFTALDDIKNIQYILDNGEIPEDKSGEEQLREFLLKQLKALGSKTEEDGI